MSQQESGTETIIELISKLKGGKLIGVTANLGPVPSFNLLFENGDEAQGSLTFQPALQYDITSGVAVVRARIEINVSGWRK